MKIDIVKPMPARRPVSGVLPLYDRRVEGIRNADGSPSGAASKARNNPFSGIIDIG